MNVFNVIRPTKKEIPFILSIPHSGTSIPNEKLAFFNKKQLKLKEDTDWFLDRLYDFAPEMGVTTILANYHRWIVDLNRDPNNHPLYNDGRIITSICPITNFKGENIYKDNYQPDQKEISSRIESYFSPYHIFLSSLINKFLKNHSKVILWDGHSIKRFVPSINPTKFPDLIIGNNDHQSCQKELTKIAFDNLKKSDYQVQMNRPFKGGYITRFHGNPSKGINSIQLEMSKDLYMSERETIYDQNKANKIQKLLISTFQELIDQL